MGPVARFTRLRRDHPRGADPDAGAPMPVTSDHVRFVDLGWATATGPRADNQDRAAIGASWAVVSDGAGGHPGGDRAAELTVEAVVAIFDGAVRGEGAVVDRALERADDAVRRGRDDPEVPTMAATVTAALAGEVTAGGSTWWLANVGDSPAWRVGPERAAILLPADNVAAELVRVGMISEEEAASHPGRHRITRAVGGLTGPSRPAVAVSLEPGEALVLASDGLVVLDGPAITRVVAAGTSARATASDLVAAAIEAGTTDNVTAVVVRHHRSGVPSGHH